MASPEVGNSLLLENHQIRRLIASYVGENKELERQYLAGEVEIELTPQGTLADGCGPAAPASQPSTPGRGSAPRSPKGACPIRYAAEVRQVRCEPKPIATRSTGTVEPAGFVRELALRPDVGLVRAGEGRPPRQSRVRKAARNFNPLCAMAAKVTIAEVEHLVEPGGAGPRESTRPALYVRGSCR